jgi:hypothetical protein
MYVNVSRSQTEEAKLEYSAYYTQTGSLSEADFGSHATTPAKEEPSLFTTTTSQPPSQQQQQQQQQQQSALPGTASPADSGDGSQVQQQQQPAEQPTLADYNQSTSKGHEILSQVGIFIQFP